MKSVTKKLKWDQFEEMIDRKCNTHRREVIDVADKYFTTNVESKIVYPFDIFDKWGKEL